MKLNKVLAIFYLLLIVFGGSSFFLIDKRKNMNPRPIESEKTESESEEENARLAWIEKMHSAAPGTNWRTIEQQNRWERYENSKKKFRIAQTSLDTIANGALTGNWIEKGSLNQSGRIVTAEFDSVNNLVYCGSAGGIVWKGNPNGTNWIPLNDKLKFNDILMIRLIPHGAGMRLLVATGGVPFFYSSDDGGATWNTPGGLGSLDGSVVRSVVVDDPGKTIYLLAREWDQISWQSVTSIYRSTDHGNSFTQVTTYEEAIYGSIDGFDLWAPRYGNISPFLINQDGTTLTLYQLNSSTGMPQQVSQKTITSGSKVLLTGFVASPLIFYVYSDKRVYRSADGGTTWQFKSTLAQDYFSRNSFQCSFTVPNTVFFGGMEAYRTVNSGASWIRLNGWAQYYGSPASKLHADISCVQPFINGSEKQFIGTDGGLFVSSDTMKTVNNISLSGLNVSQYYTTYTHRVDTNIVYAGAQDQGFQTSYLNTGVPDFTQQISGDYGHIVSSNGGNSIWTVYPSFAGYEIAATNNQNWFTATWDFNGSTEYWMPPLMADPLGASNICYLAGSSVTTSGSHIIKLEASGSNINATELPFNFMSGSGGYVSAMTACQSNVADWYAVTGNGVCFYSPDTGQSWIQSQGPSAPQPHYFYGSAIYAMKTVPGKVFIGGSGYSNPPVFVSTNHIQTLSAASNGLPSTLVYELTADPNENFLFAATEAGPYVYVIAQNQWYPMSTANSPDQTYWSVDYVQQTNSVRFGTYGRGIWDFRIESPSTVNVNPVLHETDFSVHPNPSNGKFRIGNIASMTEIKVFDINGKQIYIDRKGNKDIDLSNEKAGIYFVEVSVNGDKSVRKIVLQ
jgi:hypothetical protein